MKTKSITLRTGYEIIIQSISDEVNHIIIYDKNLYPDSDSRSEERREWIIPINDIKQLKKIGKLIKKL